MLLTSTAPRGAPVPLCRPRQSRPEAAARIVVAPALVLALCATTDVAAAPVSAVRVEERDDLSVRVTIEVQGAPTFQVFRLPGRDAFAVELPGSDLRQAGHFLGQEKVVLQRATIDAEREPPRVMLEFYDEVDYDARTSDGKLEVLFRPLSGRTALRKAHALRVEHAESRKRSEHALAETRRALSDERAAMQQVSLELEQRRSLLSELEKRRASLQREVAEEQEALSAVKSQVEEANRALRTAKSQAEEMRRAVQAAISQNEETKRALDAAKSQEEEANRAVSYLKQERGRLSRDIEASRRQSTEEQAKLEGRKREGQAAQLHLEQLRRDIDASEARRASLKAEVAALVRNAEERAKASDAASLRQRELTDQLTELERARASERAALDADKAEEARMQLAIAAQRRALATLVKQASEEDARREAAQRERAAALAEIDASARQLKGARAELEMIERQQSEVRARLASLPPQPSKVGAPASPLAPAPAANPVKEQSERQLLVAKQQQKIAEGEQRLEELERQVARAEEQLRGVQLDTERANVALQSAKASLDQTEQRRQQLSRAVSDEQAKLTRVTEAITRASAQKSHAAVARAPTTSGGLELASATPTESFGFGGKSVDLKPPPTTKNRYVPDDGYGGDDDVVGDLSHITVQRTAGAGSRVGVLVEGGARYAVKRPSAREVVLTLFATRAANLDVRRILDARDLRASVLRVLPHVEEGSRDFVELTVELREATSVRVAQDGTMLWLHIGG